jgi:hypothetical protein
MIMVGISLFGVCANHSFISLFMHFLGAKVREIEIFFVSLQYEKDIVTTLRF